MKNTLRWLLSGVLLACLLGCVMTAQAQDSDDSTGQTDRSIVSVGHGSVLPAGESAEAVVSVLGSSKVDGNVSDSAVAVLGDVTLNGSAGDSAVAVLGDAYINGKVNGDVVAVLGNVTLGPQAVVGGDVTTVMGRLERSPTAVVQGSTTHVLSGLFGNVEGLHAWFKECLLYGRPLAPSSDVSWAWWLALATLAFYLLIAAVFRDGVHRCVQTLEAHPGPSILATVLATLLLPVVLMILVITVVGIAVIPLLWIGLFCAGVFGRIVALGWLGGRCLRLGHTGLAAQPVLDVLVGGILALALYMVPVLGMLVYVLLGVFGFGAVIYTLLIAIRPPQVKPPISGSRPGVPGGASPATGSSAAAAAYAPGASMSAADAAGAGAAADTASPGAQMDTNMPPPPPHGAAAAAGPMMIDVATLPRAGFWIRMLALLIDLILVGVAMSWLHHGSGGLLVLLAAYGAIMWKLKGTTVGGIVCDLKVVRIGGGPLDWVTAIVRALGCFLSLVIACLGFIWIAIDHEHQAWHDKIAGTVVVRVPKGAGLI
jgi:uncharacterized RDD family membrane protein YckC/cytoskeletal protein CcmA (bactofilin family)